MIYFFKYYTLDVRWTSNSKGGSFQCEEYSFLVVAWLLNVDEFFVIRALKEGGVCGEGGNETDFAMENSFKWSEEKWYKEYRSVLKSW